MQNQFGQALRGKVQKFRFNNLFILSSLSFLMPNKKRFNKICKDIKDIKIQGARNIAKAALYAYSIYPSFSSKKKLLSLRPTEPMLVNVLNRIEKEK